MSLLVEDLEAKLKPTVLVVHVNNMCNKKHQSAGSDEHYHYSMIISDGSGKKMPVFVANSLNRMLESGMVNDGSIVKLVDYKPFRTNHFKTITVTDMKICKPGYDSKLKCSTEGTEVTEQKILTEGAIALIAGGDRDAELIVQALYLFKSTDERNMMLISDGQHMQIAVLASQLDRYVTEKQLKKGTVIQVIDYLRPTVQNRMSMVVKEMRIIHSDYDVIGEPKLYVKYHHPNTNSTILGGNMQFLGRQPPNMMQPLPVEPPRFMMFPPMFPSFTNLHFQFACYQQQYGLYQRQFKGYQYQCARYNRLESRMRKEREKHQQLKLEMAQKVKRFEDEINALKKDLEAAKKAKKDLKKGLDRANKQDVGSKKHVELEKTSEGVHFPEIEAALGEFGFMTLQ